MVTDSVAVDSVAEKDRSPAEKLREVFDAIDTDKSGMLDRNEMKTVMQQLGMTDDQMMAALSTMKKEQLDFD